MALLLRECKRSQRLLNPDGNCPDPVAIEKLLKQAKSDIPNFKFNYEVDDSIPFMTKTKRHRKIETPLDADNENEAKPPENLGIVEASVESPVPSSMLEELMNLDFPTQYSDIQNDDSKSDCELTSGSESEIDEEEEGYKKRAKLKEIKGKLLDYKRQKDAKNGGIKIQNFIEEDSFSDISTPRFKKV